MSDVNADKESWVRRRAYQLWQEAGEGHGSHEDHWHEAEREYEQAMGTAPGTAPIGDDLEQDSIEMPPPAGMSSAPGDEAPPTAAETDKDLPGKL